MPVMVPNSLVVRNADKPDKRVVLLCCCLCGGISGKMIQYKEGFAHKDCVRKEQI